MWWAHRATYDLAHELEGESERDLGLASTDSGSGVTE